jgi:hypothetical protein
MENLRGSSRLQVNAHNTVCVQIKQIMCKET